MSYKFSFADNATYGAADVNAITKRLVTSGVEDSFTEGIAYNVSKFNEAGKLLYTSGAIPETCLSLKVESVGTEQILINPGKAFFNDGAYIEIEAGGETLSYVPGYKNYVYLKNDLIDTNICYPYCGVAEPTGDYVLLAEIDKSGVITDKRTYAQGKLPGYQSVVGSVLIINETVSKVAETTGSILTGSATFDIGSNNYEYILVYTPFEDSDAMPCLGIYDIAKGTYTGFFSANMDDFGNPYGGSYSSAAIYSQCDVNRDVYAYLEFNFENGKLTVDYTRLDFEDKFTEGKTYNTQIKLFLF